MTDSKAALDDDLNTAVVLAALAEWIKNINSVKAGTESLTAADIEKLRADFATVVGDILGIRNDAQAAAANDDLTDGLMRLLLDLRKQAKANKDFATSDAIRNQLQAMGIVVKDTKDGAEWSR
jgi:cysteinyl-tRNA synthetase